MTVTATDTTVSTLTDYEFSIENTDGVDITAGSVIVISFPTDYLGLLTNGAYNCSYTAWFQPVTLSCSFNGVTLTVADGFPVDRLAFGQIDLYNFVVYNITNPPYAVYTDVFNGEFDSASGTQLTTMQSNGGSGILLTAGALSIRCLNDSVRPDSVANDRWQQGHFDDYYRTETQRSDRRETHHKNEQLLVKRCAQQHKDI